MSDQETIVFNLEVQVSEMTSSELRKLELIASRAINLMRRMGLPEDIDAGVAKLQHFIMMIRLAHTAMIALNSATAMNPLGLFMGALSLGTLAFTATDYMMNMG